MSEVRQDIQEMTKKEWKKQIKESTMAAGTYQPFFDAAIDTLAGVLESRDNAQQVFDDSGGKTVILHTNKGGATNLVKNPALVIVTELNAQALAFWRDLGLTPSGLKKINEAAMKGKKRSALADALKELGG